jgi:pimeloyl-ACP methyl ester carboxylesterase
MFENFRRGRAALALGTLVMALLAPYAAKADQIVLQDGGGTVVSAVLRIAGTDYDVDWYLPSGNPLGFAVVEHGFTRKCANQRETTRELMNRGLMALCVNASMVAGNPGLAEALAAVLVGALQAPDGRPVPDRIVVGGHSAGGHFASRLGWSLAALAPSRLAGAVLFDPVAAVNFSDNLSAISAAGSRPVLAITSNASGCNANNNADPALRRVRDEALANGRDGFVGVQLTDRSTHVDSEGNDTNLLGTVACRQGWPRPFNVSYLRQLAAAWALDLVTGGRSAEFYPGGSYVESMLALQDARLIE